MAYKQGLSDDFVRALNDLHGMAHGEWWTKMLADPDLFVAIRNEYLNVYYRGCSLAKIRLDTSGVFVETHYKYLLKPQRKPEYVTARDGKFDLGARFAGITDVLTDNLASLSDLKLAAKPYAGEEKKFVGGIIATHDNIIDVEVALTHEDEDTGSKSAKRLDLVALDTTSSVPTVRFYEAKLFANKEIRSQGQAKVVGQMQTYETLLKRYASDLLDGLRRSCENLLALRGVTSDRSALARRALSRIADTKIDPKPHLIVGVFDDAQRQGEAWRKQREKLEEALGEDRVILRGSAASVSLANGKRTSRNIAEAS